MMNEFLNRWLFYPWQENTDADALIHPQDRSKLKNLNVVTCIEVADGYLVVIDKHQKLRVKAEGIKALLPTPAFIWDEEVRETEKPFRRGFVEDFFWDQKKQNYFFQLRFDGRISKKCYSDDELELL